MPFIFTVLMSVVLSGFSLTGHAFNNDSLWLPKRFEHFRPLLVSAALDMEATERCAKVITGEMSRARSTPSMPAFVLVCKDHNNRSYTTVLKKSIDELPKSEDEEGGDEQDAVISAANDGAVIDVLDSEKLRLALSGQDLSEEGLSKEGLFEEGLFEKEKVVTGAFVEAEFEKKGSEEKGSAAKEFDKSTFSEKLVKMDAGGEGVETVSISLSDETQQACKARLQTETDLFLQDVVVTREAVVLADNREVQVNEFSGSLLASDETAAFISRCYQKNAKRIHFSLKPV